MVDGHVTAQNTQGDNYHLDLDGILFLGKFISPLEIKKRINLPFENRTM